MGETSNGSILKFVLGMVAGMALSYGYVRWNLELPAIFTLPGQVRDSVISSAAEEQLYDPVQSDDVRGRALEVLFGSRAKFAAEVDREAGSPFLVALHRRRAVREARQLNMMWRAFEAALAKPALRAALERKHGTDDAVRLSQAMMLEAVRKRSFLAHWLERNVGPLRPEALQAMLAQVARLPPQRVAGQP